MNFDVFAFIVLILPSYIIVKKKVLLLTRSKRKNEVAMHTCFDFGWVELSSFTDGGICICSLPSTE